MEDAPARKKIVAYGREFLVTPTTDETKFLAFISRINFDGPNGCWLWTADTRRGYAVFHYQHHETPAYRFAYESLVGPIPVGHHIHHKIEEPVRCCGPLCVHAPDHLKAVSPVEHLQLHGKKLRSATRRNWLRKVQGLCPKGHKMFRYTYPDGHVTSRCRTCRNEARRAQHAEYRAENPTRQSQNICHHGHPFTEESTGYFKSGIRFCKICRDERAARWRAKNQAKLDKFNAARRKGPSRKELAGRDTCANGHPWTEENTTYVNGYRKCRECLRQNAMRHYENTKVLKGHHKTHCIHGHELTPENLYIAPKTGRRGCKICRLAAKHRNREK